MVEAARGTIWYGTHKTGTFIGYWSFESAALAKVAGIDDSALEGHDNYPYELAHYTPLAACALGAVEGGVTTLLIGAVEEGIDPNAAFLDAGIGCVTAGTIAGVAGRVSTRVQNPTIREFLNDPSFAADNTRAGNTPKANFGEAFTEDLALEARLQQLVSHSPAATSLSDNGVNRNGIDLLFSFLNRGDLEGFTAESKFRSTLPTTLTAAQNLLSRSQATGVVQMSNRWVADHLATLVRQGDIDQLTADAIENGPDCYQLQMVQDKMFGTR